MCDGNYEFNRKGKVAMIVNNPVIIILSNYEPDKVFTEITPEFQVRYQVIELPIGLRSEENFPAYFE